MKHCFEVDTDELMEVSGLVVVHTDVEMEDVSIVDSNVSMPRLRGEGTSFVQLLSGAETMQQRLNTFYKSATTTGFKKHKWDTQRARNSEFIVITKRILKSVGGSIGCRRKSRRWLWLLLVLISSQAAQDFVA
ncbi:hypothetical protein EDD21DRAFT_409568 [Dissophora ornata]|nr:hypothetical protein EDD21DRAFT_409568 [Dissophora ornata]